MNKTALITGASSGIGENLTRIMIANGWKVIGLARRVEKLIQLKEELGEEFIPVQCDVSERKQVKKVSNDLKKKNILPTYFFLGAGIRETEIKSLDFEIEKRIFDTNYFGVISFIDEWLEYGIQSGSIFICVSSALIELPVPKDTAYCASKNALKSCFESLRTFYANSKATFITVIPGATKTSMLRLKEKRNSLFILEPYKLSMYIYKNSLKRKEIIIYPYIINIILFLISLLPKKRIKKFFDRNFT